MALKFGIATQIYTALPAVKGDHRAFGVFPNGDALVLKGSSGDRSDHLNLFEHWTVQGLAPGTEALDRLNKGGPRISSDAPVEGVNGSGQ